MKAVKFLATATLAVGIVAVTAGSVFAGPGDIAYRQGVMKAVGGHMGAMSTILKGQGGNMKDFAMHATAMAGLAHASQGAFPKDSSKMEGKTEALDAIWDKPADFAKVNAAFVMHADKLAAAAKSGDKAAIGAAMGELGKNACKACHTSFREKK
jgi:cytochrome c556